MLNIRFGKKASKKKTTTSSSKGKPARAPGEAKRGVPKKRKDEGAEDRRAPRGGGGEKRPRARRLREDPAARAAGQKGDEELTLAEVFDVPWRDRMANIGVYVVGACAVVGAAFLVGFLLWLYSGGFGGADGAAAAPASSSDRELAISTAENFSAAYLKMDAGESESDVEERLAGFATPEAASAVAPKTSGKTTRTVAETSAYDARALRDGRWVVHTRSTVETGGAGGAPAGETSDGSSDGEQQSAESSSSSSAADKNGEAAPATTKTMAMEVFVAVNDGEAAVDAAPNLIKPPAASDGSYGAIFAENGSPLSDEDLISMLEGYFDSLYGSAESQATLDRFFVEGSPAATGPPALPDDGLSFVEMGEGWAYPVGNPADGSGGFADAYDVEVIVRVADEEAGITANQTHLLRVTRDGDSWAIVGTTPTVGTGASPSGSTGASGGAPEEKGGER